MWIGSYDHRGLYIYRKKNEKMVKETKRNFDFVNVFLFILLIVIVLLFLFAKIG